jgi:hypothetical protein
MKQGIISIVKAELLLLYGQKFPSFKVAIIKSLKVVILSVHWQMTLIGTLAVSGCASEFSGERSSGQSKQT